VIEKLLGEMSPREFLDRFYTRLPHSRPGGASGFTSFPGWPAVESILAAPGVDAFAAREGRMWEGGRHPTRDLFGQGWTLVIRSAEKHDAELARLAAGFHEFFAAPVNVHVYCTPPERSGFSWHYDPEDVFIVQTHGAKEYQLRKNTVNPWPLLEQMPKDLKYEREVQPFWSCVLRPGDWLYIPTGWWHSARGVEGDSITLAIGLMTPAAIDLLDFLRKELLSSVIWRQRLPTQASFEAYQSLLKDLGRDLSRLVTDEALVRRFLESKRI